MHDDRTVHGKGLEAGEDGPVAGAAAQVAVERVLDVMLCSGGVFSRGG